MLESVRTVHVAQMIGRFGRNLDVENGERNITFVATDAVLNDLADYHVSGVEWLVKPLQRDIIATLRDWPTATTKEIAETVGCSKEHVRQTLVRLEERAGTSVERRRRAGPHGADEWRTNADGAVDDVQLRLDEIANSPVRNSSTWQLAVVDTHVTEVDVDPAKEPAVAPDPSVAGGDS